MNWCLRDSILEMESAPGEDAVQIVEMKARKLEYYMNLVNKAAAGLRGLTNFEISSTVGKTLSNRIACYREIVHERVSGCSKLHGCI